MKNSISIGQWRTLRGAAIVSFLFVIIPVALFLSDYFVNPNLSILRNINSLSNINEFNLYYLIVIIGFLLIIINLFIWIFGSISAILKSSKVNSGSMTIISALWLIFSSIFILLPLIVATLCSQQIKKSKDGEYEILDNEVKWKKALKNQIEQNREMQNFYEDQINKQRLALTAAASEIQLQKMRPQLAPAPQHVVETIGLVEQTQKVQVNQKLLEIQTMLNSGLISEKEYQVLKKRILNKDNQI